MTDSTYAGILAQIDAKISLGQSEAQSLKAQIAQLNSHLERCESENRELISMRERIAALHQTEIEKNIQPPQGFASRQRQRVNSISWRVRRHAYIALKSAGHPMSRAELLEKVLEAGIEISASNPAHAVAKILWAAKEFEYKDNGYWIAGEPMPHLATRPKRFRSPKRRN